MGTLKGSNVASARQKWNTVFNTLVHMLQTQQTQIDSLARERKLLEDRIKLQHERWISDVNLFRDQISQMEKDFVVQEMMRNVEAAKSDLIQGQKQREAFSYKIKLDDAVDELADFRVLFDYLSCKCGETNENSSNMLALLSERNFVWNQYKKRESDLTYRLKSKTTEVEQAKEKIQELLTSMERLQSSFSDKDSMVLNLETNVAELEAASVRKNEEISRLSRELELLRKARSDSVTPALRRCSTKSRLGDKGEGKEPHPSRAIEKGCGSSKRKAVDTIPISETPTLFTSTFKVPKLKNPSPRVV